MDLGALMFAGLIAAYFTATITAASRHAQKADEAHAPRTAEPAAPAPLGVAEQQNA